MKHFITKQSKHFETVAMRLCLVTCIVFMIMLLMPKAVFENIRYWVEFHYLGFALPWSFFTMIQMFTIEIIRAKPKRILRDVLQVGFILICANLALIIISMWEMLQVDWFISYPLLVIGMILLFLTYLPDILQRR